MQLPTEIVRSPALSPYIVVRDAAAAIAFYVAAFGAVEAFRLVDPADGRIGHAELRIAGSTLMLSDEYPDFGAVGPSSLGGSPVKLHLYVADVNSVFAAALALGASEVRPVKQQFYGDRSGMLTDPFGHSWFVATRTQEVTPAEMQQRWSDAVTA